MVIDREFPGSISTRKLVIETAKFNVITAYSGMEAYETAQRFPALSGAVVDGGTEDIPCAKLCGMLKELLPNLPIIVIAGPGFAGCPYADLTLETFEPAKLLDALRELKPVESAAIEKRNEELSLEKLS